MDKIYNKKFYESCCGDNYDDTETWTNFFGSVARNIVESFSPKTVLDAGCAYGYLVKALRDLGVEAYGFDISEFAVSQADESIRSYVTVHSITERLPDNFPINYDLVITIEVLEHISPADGIRAIKNLCSYSDTIVFTSTPNDLNNRTHVNVQQQEYWAKIFAENSFYHDLIYPVDFICPWAMLFRKKDNICDVIFDYEMNRRIDKLSFDKALAESENRSAILYFKNEDDFSENSSIKISYSGSAMKTGKIAISIGCQSIRFDPVEGYNCIVSNLVIGSSNGILPIQEGNNDRFIDGNYFFSTSDPQLYIPIPNGTVWIEISCNIVVLENIFVQKVIWDLETLSDLKEKEIEEKNTIIFSLKEKSAQFERDIEETKAVISKQKEENTVLNSKIKALLCDKENVDAELATYQEHYHAAMGQVENLKAELTDWQNSYNSISRSQFWRITAPARKMCDGIKKLLRSNKVTYLFCKGLLSLKREGVKATWRRVKMKYSSRYCMKEIVKNMSLSVQERKQQEETVFPRDIKFSILVPLYNTPINFLEEMIASVISQTYSNWELCLADGSDKNHVNVEKAVKKIQADEKRIKYQKLEKNLGISENTNACIDMAEGDYIALFDHDDLLHPAALFEIMKAICEKNADFIYTDEMVFESPDINKIRTVHYKPDYAIDTLRANNYICHFSVFSCELLDQAGKFRSECDGSQDHDLILRLTSYASSIVHIPKVLYFWRSHSSSVAQSIDFKPYVGKAGQKAVFDSIAGAGQNCSVESSAEFPSIYRIRYDIASRDKVSIITVVKKNYERLIKCIDSILKETIYINYEIIIVDSGASDENFSEYYSRLKAHENIKIFHVDQSYTYTGSINLGASKASGEYYLFLNYDTQIITPAWIDELLMYVQRDDVGAAGGLLYYTDDTIRHAGIVLGMGRQGAAGRPFYRCSRQSFGYMGRLCYSQNVTAVSSEIMLVKRDIFKKIKGFDEDFKDLYSDIDFCMKIRSRGYLIVWTPYAKAYHLTDPKEEESIDLSKSNCERFKQRWKKELEQGDPYFNPNFSAEYTDFRLK